MFRSVGTRPTMTKTVVGTSRGGGNGQRPQPRQASGELGVAPIEIGGASVEIIFAAI